MISLQLKTNQNVMTKYKRILLKLSGESLMGVQQHGIDQERLNDYAEEIAALANAGVQVGIVIGGGNIPTQQVRCAELKQKQMLC